MRYILGTKRSHWQYYIYIKQEKPPWVQEERKMTEREFRIKIIMQILKLSF